MAKARGIAPDGTYGARGVAAERALSDALDDLAAETDRHKGVFSRLRYLVGTERGYETLREALPTTTKRTLESWLAESSTPRPETQARINRAYEQTRRRNLAPSMKKRLAHGGAGSQVEIHPIDQASVATARRRAIGDRRINVRPSQWNDIVDAWSKGDMAAMERIWEPIAQEGIGTDWAAYLTVSSIGIGA